MSSCSDMGPALSLCVPLFMQGGSCIRLRYVSSNVCSSSLVKPLQSGVFCMGRLLVIDFVSFDPLELPFFFFFLVNLLKCLSQRNLSFQIYRIWHKLVPGVLL